MSTNSQDQEIDLGQVFSKIGGFFTKLIERFFDFIFFLKKKILVIIVLFITGVVLAFLIDFKVYKHEVSVIPNFGSNEYLYKKIEQINAKLKENDSIFFKQLGIKRYDKIKEIEIDAYPAIYSFVNNKDQENNFDFIKLMAEDGNIEKIMKDEITSKNYYHHKIAIQTNGVFNKEEFITPILNYLNSNPFFETQKQVYQKNLKEKISLNDSLINQIYNLILLLSTNSSSGSISISEKNSIPELIEKKDKLIIEKQKLLNYEIINNQIIKEESSILNIREYKPLLLNNKVLFPLILILIYLLSYFLLATYKKQSERIKK